MQLQAKLGASFVLYGFYASMLLQAIEELDMYLVIGQNGIINIVFKSSTLYLQKKCVTSFFSLQSILI